MREPNLTESTLIGLGLNFEVFSAEPLWALVYPKLLIIAFITDSRGKGSDVDNIECK
jgi:hypothetical protein